MVIRTYSVGERAEVKEGPFRGQFVTLLGFTTYRSSQDEAAQKKANDKAAAWANRKLKSGEYGGIPLTGWMTDSGRIYDARFDDGRVTKILDTEIERI